jgi:hypothetical protein
MRRVLAAAVAAATLLLPAAEAGSASAPLRVLFVGNSLTAANDLPAMVAALGARTGTPIAYETRVLASPSRTTGS